MGVINGGAPSCIWQPPHFETRPKWGTPYFMDVKDAAQLAPLLQKGSCGLSVDRNSQLMDFLIIQL